MSRRSALLAVCLSGLSLGARERARQYPLWQADLQVRHLTVSEARGNLTARVVIVAENGEALAARVEVLLPVGVGIVALGPSCVAGPNRTGISELRARVECTLGNMPARSSRELYVVTTTPPAGIARGFAAVAMSDTPDPKPANNFAERALPPPDREDESDRGLDHDR